MYFDQPPLITFPLNATDGLTETVKYRNESENVVYSLVDKKMQVEMERITPFLYSAPGQKAEKADGRCGRIIYTPKPIAEFESLVSYDED
jgi:hypothetical protein